MLVILTVLIVACDAFSDGTKMSEAETKGKIATDTIVGSEQPLPTPTPTPNITIEFVGGTNPEFRRVRRRPISQNNCGGTAKVESNMEISHSIEHTIEVGGGFEVSASGAVKIVGTGVDLGVTVAGEFGRSYGTKTDISQSIKVAAEKGTNMEHHIKVIEVWEVGTAEIVLNGKTHKVPFSFRNEVELGLDQSVNIGCTSAPTATQVSEPTPTFTATSTNTPTATPTATSTATPTTEPRTPTLTPEPEPTRHIRSIDKDITIRDGPGTDYPILGFLSPGTEVEVLGRNSTNDWFYINPDRAEWLFADADISQYGWISDSAFNSPIAIANVSIQTPSPVPLLAIAPVLVAPENGEEFIEVRPDLIWTWEEDKLQDPYHFYEITIWLDDQEDPIDVALGQYPCYRYDLIRDEDYATSLELWWSISVVKGFAGKEKTWSPLQCGQWEDIRVYDPHLIMQQISEMSERRLVRIVARTPEPISTPTSDPGPDPKPKPKPTDKPQEGGCRPDCE